MAWRSLSWCMVSICCLLQEAELKTLTDHNKQLSHSVLNHAMQVMFATEGQSCCVSICLRQLLHSDLKGITRLCSSTA